MPINEKAHEIKRKNSEIFGMTKLKLIASHSLLATTALRPNYLTYNYSIYNTISWKRNALSE